VRLIFFAEEGSGRARPIVCQLSGGEPAYREIHPFTPVAPAEASTTPVEPLLIPVPSGASRHHLTPYSPECGSGPSTKSVCSIPYNPVPLRGKYAFKTREGETQPQHLGRQAGCPHSRPRHRPRRHKELFEGRGGHDRARTATRSRPRGRTGRVRRLPDSHPLRLQTDSREIRDPGARACQGESLTARARGSSRGRQIKPTHSPTSMGRTSSKSTGPLVRMTWSLYSKPQTRRAPPRWCSS
jgi:hypothetical protein